MRLVRGLMIAIALMTFVIWIAWRSGERPAIDEVALAEAEIGVELESRRIRAGELTLHVVFAGPESGPPVLLLHGFPEFWFSWHRQLGALAKAGFRAMAPDLRGYNRSDKPRDSQVYATRHFTGDMLALLDALKIDDVFLAGHDVGGGVAWNLALNHAKRVRRAILFNAAHPDSWIRALPSDDPETISWFRTFFKIPWLPELVGRSGDWWLLSRNLVSTSRPGTFGDDVLDVYKAAWSRDNAISTMINSYRSSDIESAEPDGGAPVPVRVVWGRNDAFFPPAAAKFTAEIVGEDAFVEVADATHWILIEEPELTSQEMIDFFSEE